MLHIRTNVISAGLKIYLFNIILFRFSAVQVNLFFNSCFYALSLVVCNLWSVEVFTSFTGNNHWLYVHVVNSLVRVISLLTWFEFLALRLRVDLTHNHNVVLTRFDCWRRLNCKCWISYLTRLVFSLLKQWKCTNQPASHTLLLMLSFFAFTLCTHPCLITHSFLMLHRLSGTVSLADHQTLSRLSCHLWNLTFSRYPIDSVCVCVCAGTRAHAHSRKFKGCFDCVLNFYFVMGCAPLWRNSAWKSTLLVLSFVTYYCWLYALGHTHVYLKVNLKLATMFVAAL